MVKDPLKQLSALGLHARAGTAQITAIEMAAFALSILWLVVTAILLFASGGGATRDGGVLAFILVVLAVFMPVAIIWLAAVTMRSARTMREDSERLQAILDEIRRTYLEQAQSHSAEIDRSTARKLEELATASRRMESLLGQIYAARAIAPRTMPDDETPPPANPAQDSLPLEIPAQESAKPLGRIDFIRALNFPETPEDQSGFNALRKALKNHSAAQLLRSAQDVLTLLSQDGIYMDDLRPDTAVPELWRQFAKGETGRPVAMLGGVRDQSSLALTAARLKNDHVFRDTAHHFLRLFDKMFAQFAETATDEEISALSETRTARAFMLLGFVMGTFE